MRAGRTNLHTIWALNGLLLGSNVNMLTPGLTLRVPTLPGTPDVTQHGIVLDSMKYNRVVSLTTYAGAYVTTQGDHSTAFAFSFNTW
jgi:hypothetical protein